VAFVHHLSDGREVAEYVTGEMPARRAAALELHLGRCPVCRDAVAEYRRTARRRANLVAGSAVQWPDTGSLVLVGSRRRLVSNAVPVLGCLVTFVTIVAVLLAAWQAGASTANADLVKPTSEFTASGVALSDYDVAELRRAGWTCADLRAGGYATTSATGITQGDVAAVTTSYAGKDGSVVLTEERSLSGGGAPASPAGATADGTPRTFVVAGARFVLDASLSGQSVDALEDQVRDMARDAQSDAEADVAAGWDRLARGFTRLVDPTR